ncbi:hypothetical protein HED55_19345 [Ochrobactrum haematophilum]|uniref:Uncharacterized protein n=1 Tax=Brucella haematophila TaxID=419474 RepID=A0ABX1DSS6_9HYPH|nr:hypothetical protein [Brucella haematophila]
MKKTILAALIISAGTMVSSQSYAAACALFAYEGLCVSLLAISYLWPWFISSMFVRNFVGSNARI